MLQSLKSLLRLGPKPPSQSPALSAGPVQVVPDGVRSAAAPVYPPVDGGIPMMAADAVIATQAALITRLRRHLALPEAEFDRNYLRPVRRAAELVGLLPATKTKYFTGQGGLFRMCLEMAVFAAQGADGVMFAGHAAIERRRKVENAWRHAAFFCGLAVELHRPLTEMVVVEPDSGMTWNPFMGPLTEWATKAGHQRVFVRWVDHAVQQAGAKSTAVWSLNYLIGQPVMAALHEVDPTIVQTMAGVVTDSITVVDDHPLARLIRSVRRAAIERDQALKPSLYGALTQGSHLEPWILDAMRSLALDGDWTVNERSSRLNWGKEGCFIVWPLGAKDVIKRMEDRKVKGVPSQEATLADMLLTAGVIARAQDGGALWSIRTVHDPDKEVIAVKLSNPDSVLGVLEVPPRASDQSVVVGRSSPAASTAPSAVPVQPPAPKVKLVNSATGEILEPAAKSEPDGAREPVGKASPTKGPPPTDASADSAPGEDTRSRAGALKQVAPASPDVSSLDKQIVAALGPAAAAVIAGWVDDWNNSRRPAEFKRVQDGLAVRLLAVTKCGLETPALVEPLKSNGWLHSTEVGGKKRIIAKVDFGDREDAAYTLKESFAKRCGFVLT